MVVVCFSEPLMRRMSSANHRLDKFMSGFVFGKFHSVIISLRLSCQWFHDVLQE